MASRVSACSPRAPPDGNALAFEPGGEGGDPLRRPLHLLAWQGEDGADAFRVGAPRAAIHHHAGVAVEQGGQVLLIELLAVDPCTEPFCDTRCHEEPAVFADPLHAECRSDEIAPGSEVERHVAGIWRELLGVERVGPNDAFFDLGGHSLLALRAQRKLSDALGREVPLLDLFAHPTPRALAQHLAGGGAGDDSRLAAARDRAERQRAAVGARANRSTT